VQGFLGSKCKGQARERKVETHIYIRRVRCTVRVKEKERRERVREKERRERVREKERRGERELVRKRDL
jgi:hypothetical protein